MVLALRNWHLDFLLSMGADAHEVGDWWIWGWELVNFWLQVQASVPASTDSISSSAIENLHGKSSDKLLRQTTMALLSKNSLSLNPKPYFFKICDNDEKQLFQSRVQIAGSRVETDIRLLLLISLSLLCCLKLQQEENRNLGFFIVGKRKFSCPI